MNTSPIQLPGPWTHRYVTANGARFHVAEIEPCRTAPLALLLHGFPEFWWAWRDQLPALADAGYRAVAMDLRGYGGSDKTPRGYDPTTLAADVAGIVRALGARDAVVIGQGWGGFVGWTVAVTHPDRVRALCAVSAPHPSELLRSPIRMRRRAPLAHMMLMQVPWLPERRIMRGSYVAQHLAAWSDPDSGFPSTDLAETYRAALSLWPSPHCALEYHRWLFRSRLRADGRAHARLMRRRVDVPVLHIGGATDPAVVPSSVHGSARHVAASFTTVELEGAGHFPHEERPSEFNESLLGWLSQHASVRDR